MSWSRTYGLRPESDGDKDDRATVKPASVNTCVAAVKISPDAAHRVGYTRADVAQRVLGKLEVRDNYGGLRAIEQVGVAGRQVRQESGKGDKVPDALILTGPLLALGVPRRLQQGESIHRRSE
jgi:hypothetical protein